MPITSYGIILFTIAKNEKGKHDIYYLLIQRRDTIEYVDALRPKCPIAQLEKWFTRMTPEERCRIQRYIDDFETLWHDLNLKKPSLSDDTYRRAKKRFEENKETILSMLVSSKSDVEELSWGFAKGRKNSKETVQDCALREFGEETCLSTKPLRPFTIESVREDFKGSDGRDYATNYFLYETFTKLPIVYTVSGSPIPGREKTISNEVNDMKWCTIEEACNLLNPRRRELLTQVDSFIRKAKGFGGYKTLF